MPENPSAITREQVAHLGRLARLSLTEDELDHYSAQLADILAAVARVTEVATPDVPATSHPMPLENVFREDVPRLQKNHILIDGAPTQGQGLLLQIFTANQIGPIFFELIQRKGNEGFGEGYFRALFESIEADQIRRGVLKAEA